MQIFTARDERQQIAATVEQRLSCECAGTVGRMAVFYRRQPDPEKRHIDLS